MKANSPSKRSLSFPDWFFLVTLTLVVAGFVTYTAMSFPSHAKPGLHALRFISLGFTLVSAVTLGLVVYKVFVLESAWASHKREKQTSPTD